MSVRNLHNSSATLCCTLGRSTTSKSRLDNYRRNCVSLTNASGRLRIHFSSAWSVLIENCVLLRHGLRGSPSVTMPNHSHCVEPRTRSALVSTRDQHLIVSIVLSDYSCSNTHSTWTWQASVPSITCPSAYGKARTGSELNFCYRLFIASSYFSISSKLNGV